MDLISREALRRKVQKVAVEAWKLKMTASVETVMNQFLDFLEQSPSVPAVPLEMISKKLGSLCKPCIFHIGCPYKSFDCDSCNTSDAWEKAIIKWMEEEDAQKEN